MRFAKGPAVTEKCDELLGRYQPPRKIQEAQSLLPNYLFILAGMNPIILSMPRWRNGSSKEFCNAFANVVLPELDGPFK